MTVCRNCAGCTIGAISPKLEAIGWDRTVVEDAGLRVDNIGTEQRVLGDALAFAAAVGAGSVWFTSGTIGSRTWEEAAADFCERIAPAVARADELGVPIAVEPTNPLRADISFVFTLRDSLALARAAGINVVLELETVPLVRGNAAELREVFLNVLLNAVDAMPSGGTVALGVRARDVDDISDDSLDETVDHPSYFTPSSSSAKRRIIASLSAFQLPV